MDSKSRIKWWKEAKLGMFVHWGCYSALKRGEQVMLRDHMPLGEYRKIADDFKPASDWADRVTDQAVKMGAKYIVLTTRHHDGYCLFDTNTHDFNAVKTGPGRDLVREYADAARARGLKVGLYYSMVNWSWKGHWDPEKYRHELPLIVQEIHDQVKELMTGYGKIDILWYDIPSVPGSKSPGSFGYGEEPIPQNAAEFFRSQELADKVRTLQPHILINNRSGTPQDFGTPEQHITADKDKRPWEACMTKNFAPNWACVNHSVADKEVGQILFYLIDAARKGGNFLFNIGPDEKGYVCERDRKDIDILGRWLERNGEAVFGTKPDPIFDGQPQGPCSQYGMFTNKGKTAYLVLFFYPRDYIVLSKITGGLKSAEILGTGQKLDISVMANRRYKVSGLPEKMPDELAAVIKLEFEEIPLTLNWSGAEWLDGEL